MAASLDQEQVKKVLRQVEFYFSDSNLPRDNFLKQSVEESEDGLVSLALICSFTRMRGHLGLGSVKQEEVPEETVLAVAETLRKSTLLKVSEDGKRIGRSTELSKPEAVIEQVDSRTIAVSPLPHDVKIEDVESFFGQHAKVNSVRLPRLFVDKRCFCGTALIEFSEEEDVKKVLNESLTYADAELEMKPKKDFDAEREKQREEFERTRPDKDTSSGSYPKGLIVSFKLKSIPVEESAEPNVQDKASTEDVSKTNGNELEGEGKNSEDAKKKNDQMTVEDQTTTGKKEESSENVEKESVEGAAEDHSDDVQKENSLEDAKNGEKAAGDDKNAVTREDIKEVLQKFGIVKYIDFRMGEESGYVRFEDSDAAVKARAAAVLTAVGGLIVKNSVATLEPLCGDAEKEYWSLLRGNQDKRKEFKGNHRGRILEVTDGCILCNMCGPRTIPTNGRAPRQQWKEGATEGRNNRGGRQFDGKRQRQFGHSADGRHNKAAKSSADN